MHMGEETNLWFQRTVAGEPGIAILVAMLADTAPSSTTAELPPIPALSAVVNGAVWIAPTGEIEDLSIGDAARRAAKSPPLVCHAPLQAARLNCPPFRAFDILELYAFVRPATFCLPTPHGIAAALDLDEPADRVAEAFVLLTATRLLLENLARFRGDPGLQRITRTMAGAGWSWGGPVANALGLPPDERAKSANKSADKSTKTRAGAIGLDVWNRLPQWEEEAPLPPPTDLLISDIEARLRLADLVGDDAEERIEQSNYAAAATAAFAPRDLAGAPNVVLAEAGTGVGKTLGYIAPSSLWAEKNGGTVWLSTYTKNLQRQIDQELDRLYPEPAIKQRKSVVRKGRENYLCLLNLEEACERATLGGGAIALGLMARWAAATRDGDLYGGDFPAWLAQLVGNGQTLGLRHHRGECVFAACSHYTSCYAERSIRSVRGADIVIANHALVLTQAVMSGDDERLPTRYVFDEGHHLFDAADSAYSANLSGIEMAELRRWLRGGEGRRAGRIRGLERRVTEMIAGDNDAQTNLAAAIRGAAALPGPGWLQRVFDGSADGPAEAFLSRVADQVAARAERGTGEYSQEAAVGSATEPVREATTALQQALRHLAEPLRGLRQNLITKLDREAGELETPVRIRIEAAIRSLTYRIDATLASWTAMLHDLRSAGQDDAIEETDVRFVDWFSIVRGQGRPFDAGMHRHWIDPTIPFAREVLGKAHGAVITSATLRDRTQADDDDTAADGEDSDTWQSAEIRTGTQHLPLPAVRVDEPSPFDYPAQTRVFIVTDVRRDDPMQVASAYRELFLAAGGGALGLFTAISRLRDIHRRIAGALEAEGLKLLAQHVDPMDTGTLVDIFRAERNTCLLGTDAVRDGVDVPGAALRLIVFERVPWARPDILHRARRNAFGGRRYDEMIARLRLKQAYGRLIRRTGDHGVFILLDRMTPTRLLNAFPEDVSIQRIGLAETIAEVRSFLATNAMESGGTAVL